MPTPAPHQLLVEGQNDKHVIWALCTQHRLPEVFSVEVPREENTKGSVSILLQILPLKLQEEHLLTLGIVVDADQNLLSRWNSVRGRLLASGLANIPKQPPAEGWISSQSNFPRVGVWLMPDNQLTGMLESFVALLIPPDDLLHSKAEAVLQDIEQAGLNRYKSIHRPKALIHTWLAWQETPGMPMGQAITAKALLHDSPIAESFISWLKRLFDLPQ